MERKRIGNDIKLRWAVFNPDGTPVDFTDKSVKVEIRNDGYAKGRYPQEVEISGNLIDLQFTAKEQQSVGVYNLWLEYTYPDPDTEGGIATVTLDNCGAFQLVSKTCELAGINEDPIYLEGVVTGLSYSNLTEAEKQDIVDRMLESPDLNTIKGDSAYQVAVDNGYQGTEEEWLASLKGDAFIYDDFTPEQLEGLKGDKGDPGDTVLNQYNDTPIKLWLSPDTAIPPAEDQENDIIYIGYEDQ